MSDDRRETRRPALDQAYAVLDQLYADLDRRLYHSAGDDRRQRHAAEMCFDAIELEIAFGPVGAATFLRLEARMAELEKICADLDARLAQGEISSGRPQSTPRGARTLVSVVDHAARLMRVAPADVRGNSGEPAAVTARVASASIGRSQLGLSATVIGRGLGGRSATDAETMIRRAELRANGDRSFAALLKDIAAALEETR